VITRRRLILTGVGMLAGKVHRAEDGGVTQDCSCASTIGIRRGINPLRVDEEAQNRNNGYSNTLVVCAKIDCGNLMPSDDAVLRLMQSMNVVGCSMGRSPGFAPLKILLTYVAARLGHSRLS
jgi:hypothetical protein